LPIDGEPTVGRHVGFTPLVKAERLGRALGLRNLYVKNDAVNHPTLSFKDRVVAVALSKAREFGYTTVACASTGNLANSVAAHAAEGGFECYVFIPSDLEENKVLGNLIYGAQVVKIEGVYDEVNRLCAEVGDKYGWAFANINLRPFYGDGSKSYGFEIAEQLGWRTPDHVIVPCAGGSLITKIPKAFARWKRSDCWTRRCRQRCTPRKRRAATRSPRWSRTRPTCFARNARTRLPNPSPSATRPTATTPPRSAEPAAAGRPT
jgi:threonine synthase